MDEQQKLSDSYMNLKIKYWNLKKLSGNCEDIARDYEILKSKHEECGKRNVELQAIIYIRDAKIHVLQKQIDSIMEKSGILLQVDGNELGRFVTQEKYIKVLEENKKLKLQK